MTTHSPEEHAGADATQLGPATTVTVDLRAEAQEASDSDCGCSCGCNPQAAPLLLESLLKEVPVNKFYQALHAACSGLLGADNTPVPTNLDGLNDFIRQLAQHRIGVDARGFALLDKQLQASVLQLFIDHQVSLKVS